MKYLKLTVLLAMLCLNNTFAQKFSRQVADEDGKPIFFEIDGNQPINTTDASITKLLYAVSGLHEPDYTFKKERTYLDETGSLHSQYKVYYRDIFVRGMDYAVHAKNNKVSYVNGWVKEIEQKETQPSISAKEAELLAKKYYEKEKPGIDNSERVVNMKELVFCSNSINSDNSFRLAYKMLATDAKSDVNSVYFFLDAATGDLLDKEYLVCTATKENAPLPPPNAPGTAQTRYTGTQNFVTDAFNGAFRLREIRNNVNILTLNANNLTDETQIVNNATDFFDNDNNWQATEHAADQVALDVHWASERIFDYWQQVRGRNSVDGNGLQIRSFVHVQNCYDNAFWLGNTNVGAPINSMFYGDGCSFYTPLSSLDVASHEIGHGICQFTAGLTSGYSQSGALNEGFSDIWGAVIEAWAAPAKSRWLIAEEIIAGTYFTCIRNLQNPNDITSNQGQSPDTYLGNFWSTTNWPHQNSTVLSHWFYLLSEGGSGTNDNNDVFNVAGIGINNAASVAYKTEQLLNSSANYTMARTMSIQAAIELFGGCSNEVVQVTNAWYAVGVGVAWVTPTSYHFYNPEYGEDCSSAIFSANFPVNSPVTWTTTNGLLINGSNSPVTLYGNSVIISSPNGQAGTIAANVGSVCSIASESFCPCEEWDNPYINWVWNSPITGEPLQAEVLPALYGAIQYQWYIGGVLKHVSYNNFMSTYNWPCTSEQDLTVVAVTACGSSQPVNGGWYSPICYGRNSSNVKLYPNPASDMVVVSIENNDKRIDESTLQKMSGIKQIKVMDKLGLVKKLYQFSKNSNIVSLDISFLTPGIYYVDITDDITNVRKPLIVKR